MKYALLLCALLALPAQAQMVDGNRLHNEFKKSDDNEARYGFTRGYLAGVHDSNAGITFCAPNEVSLGQLSNMTEKYLAENPAIRHLPAESIIIYMLKKVWPCAKKGKML